MTGQSGNDRSSTRSLLWGKILPVVLEGFIGFVMPGNHFTVAQSVTHTPGYSRQQRCEGLLIFKDITGL